MPVIVKNDELELMNKSGISNADIQRTIGAYRSEGISDIDIRSKLDGKLSSIRQAPIIAEKAEVLRPKRNMWDDVSEKIANSSVAKGVALGARNILNSSINPIGQMAKLSNVAIGGDYELPESFQLEGVQAQNATERAIEQSMGFAHDSYGIARAGNALSATGILGNGTSKLSKVARALMTGDEATAVASGLGGGAVSGAMNPESIVGQIAATMVGGFAGGMASGGISKGLNSLSISLGAENIEKQLASGGVDGFKDVRFGKVTPQQLDELNKIRELEQVAALDNRKVSIPADRLEHLYESRIMGDGYTPKDVSNVLKQAIHGKNSSSMYGNYAQLQALVDTKSDPNNVAVVGKHRNNGGVFVKTGFKKDMNEVNKGALDGRRSPSSLQSGITGKTAGRRLSAFQGYDDSIAPSRVIVNKNHLLEALADNIKTKSLKNAIVSGEKDILDKVSTLNERLQRRSAGAIDDALETDLMTPELRMAKKNYSAYIDNNGKKIISQNVMDDFYKRNPEAAGIVGHMRRVLPVRFENIQKNSIKELDELKKVLRKSRGNASEKSYTQQAYEVAEIDLKNVLEEHAFGFKDVNRGYASAETTQDLYNGLVSNNAKKLAGATNSSFWSGASSPISAAGIVGSVVSPLPPLLVAGGLLGKAGLRAGRRSSGRAIMNGRDLSEEMLKEALSGANKTFQNSKYPTYSLFLKKKTTKEERERELLQNMLLDYGK